MERDPSRTVQAARRQVHRVKRSTGRLLVAGLGFSVAYFLDPSQGRARRKQMFGLLQRAREPHLAAEAERSAPDVPRIGQAAEAGPGATFQKAADGIRAVGPV